MDVGVDGVVVRFSLGVPRSRRTGLLSRIGSRTQASYAIDSVVRPFSLPGLHAVRSENSKPKPARASWWGVTLRTAHPHGPCLAPKSRSLVTLRLKRRNGGVPTSVSHRFYRYLRPKYTSLVFQL